MPADSHILGGRVEYTLDGLLNYIDIGDIGLPDIQRPFAGLAMAASRNAHQPLRTRAGEYLAAFLGGSRRRIADVIRKGFGGI